MDSFLGCKVVIASRKLDKLSDSAIQIRSMLPAGGPAELQLLQCNIRKEDEVRVTCTLLVLSMLIYSKHNAMSLPKSAHYLPEILPKSAHFLPEICAKCYCQLFILIQGLCVIMSGFFCM